MNKITVVQKVNDTSVERSWEFDLTEVPANDHDSFVKRIMQTLDPQEKQEVPVVDWGNVFWQTNPKSDRNWYQLLHNQPTVNRTR